MIELRDVGFGFPGGREVLRSVNLAVEDGAWIAIAGGNGSGKTTLCRIIAGLRRPTAGSIRVDGGDPAVAGAEAAVGIAFQNPDSQFVTASVEREILFGMENRGLPPAEMKARLGEAARRLALERFLARNPHTLSGGEKQRVVLAGLLAMAPRRLVLDEPFSFLDASAQEAYLAGLRKWFECGSRTIVWSTVTEREIALADRVVFLHEGCVLYEGPPAGLGTAVSRELIDAGIVHEAGFSRRHDAPPRRVGTDAPERPPHAGGSASVEIREALFCQGDFSLEVAEFFVRKGETVGLAGPSGSGKTTLLLGCAGLLTPLRGRASVLGNSIRSRRDAPVGRFAFLFQSPEDGFFAPTVRDEIALARSAFHGAIGIDESIADALETVGLRPAVFLDRNPFALSQGEKRLVAVASLLVIGAELLLLDEPTIFLDGAASGRLRDLVARLHARGTTVVIASHDRSFLDSICDRVVALGDGDAAGSV